MLKTKLPLAHPAVFLRFAVRRFRYSAVLGLAWLCALTSPALKADIIFTNLTSPGFGGDAVAGASSAAGATVVALQFVPGTTEFLEDIEAQVFGFAPSFGLGNPTFDMDLFSDAAGSPGSLIEQLGSDLTIPTPGGFGEALMIVNSTLKPLLTAGTAYWLVLAPFDDHSYIAWEAGASSNVRFAATTALGNPWLSFGVLQPLQFQVDGQLPAASPGTSLTPEPFVFLPCAAAITTFGLLRRRARRRQDR